MEATKNNLFNATVWWILKENNIHVKGYKIELFINMLQKNRINFSNNDNSKFSEYISINESSFCITDLQKYGY
jgi:hypothetical protein